MSVRLALLIAATLLCAPIAAAQLRAGAAKVEITDRAAGPVNDPSFVKALVVDDGATTVVIATLDVVALEEIGGIPPGFMDAVRADLRRDLGIPPEHVIINASHCHSVVRRDAATLTVQAVKAAWGKRTAVRTGAGRGKEDRIMENRRMVLKDGTQADVRRAYAMPPDDAVVATGPVDPEIGVLRIDRADGTPLAVLYNFAAHPIQGVPGGGNTADYPAFASQVIEETLGGGALAFFVQGAAGDINPAKYKDVHQPQNAEPLGNLLGLSVLRAWRAIEPRDSGPLRVLREALSLPRGSDLDRRILAIEAERERLLASLEGTSLNFKTFVPLYVQYKLGGDFPSYYSHRYLHEKAQGREELARLDAENRAHLDRYLSNILAMEQITRLQTNLALLKKHRATHAAAGSRTLDVEVMGLRVGGFQMVTFPGELTVEVGLNIKKRAAGPYDFVAGYSNGYIYYAPTAAQRRNTGYAQEDCDSWVDPEWQQIFEDKAAEVLKRLAAR